MSSVCVNSVKRKRDIRLKRACWSPTLTLKDLLMLLLFSLRLVVCCPRLCVFNVWFPEVPPVLQPGIHGLKSSDTDPAWLSSEQSSLVVEWQKIRDLNSVTITKSVSRLDYFRQTETMIIKTHSMHPTFDLCLHCKTKSNNLSTVDINLATIGFSVDHTMKSGRDACSPEPKKPALINTSYRSLFPTKSCVLCVFDQSIHSASKQRCSCLLYNILEAKCSEKYKKNPTGIPTVNNLIRNLDSGIMPH